MGPGSYMWAIKQLREKFTNKDPLKGVTDEEFTNFIKQTEAVADNKSYGGVLFYLIVRMSEKKEYNPTKIRPSLYQTKIWQDLLGYTFIGDNNGTGIIHPSEKHQGLWFSSKYFDVIDVGVRKKRIGIKKNFLVNVHKLFSLSPDKFFKHLKHTIEYSTNVDLGIVVEQILKSFYNLGSDKALELIRMVLKASIDTNTSIDFTSIRDLYISNTDSVIKFMDIIVPFLKNGYSKTYLDRMFNMAVRSVDDKDAFNTHFNID